MVPRFPADATAPQRPFAFGCRPAEEGQPSPSGLETRGGGGAEFRMEVGVAWIRDLSRTLGGRWRVAISHWVPEGCPRSRTAQCYALRGTTAGRHLFAFGCRPGRTDKRSMFRSTAPGRNLDGVPSSDRCVPEVHLASVPTEEVVQHLGTAGWLDGDGELRLRAHRVRA